MSRKIKVEGVVTGAISYAQTSVTSITITNNTNDLNIPGLDGFSLVEITSTGNYNITGIVVPDITKA